MHVKFPAVVQHASGQVTKFLALDKVLPNRDFLQVWEFPEAKGPRELAYDEEWLAIVKSTNHLLSFRRGTVHMPTPHSSQRCVPPLLIASHTRMTDVLCVGCPRFDYWPTQEEREWIRERVAAKKDGLRVPLNFTQTAPVYTPGERGVSCCVVCRSVVRVVSADSFHYNQASRRAYCASRRSVRPFWNYSTCPTSSSPMTRRPRPCHQTTNTTSPSPSLAAHHHRCTTTTTQWRFRCCRWGSRWAISRQRLPCCSPALLRTPRTKRRLTSRLMAMMKLMQAMWRPRGSGWETTTRRRITRKRSTCTLMVLFNNVQQQVGYLSLRTYLVTTIYCLTNDMTNDSLQLPLNHTSLHPWRMRCVLCCAVVGGVC